MMRATYEHIASALSGYINCGKTAASDASMAANAVEWRARHRQTIARICKNRMPSGGGVDSGTQFDFERSTVDKLVFTTHYHHMDGNGSYDGWTDHTVIVRPSFIGRFDITVSGRNRNDIKDYLADTFRCALDEQWEGTAESPEYAD